MVSKYDDEYKVPSFWPFMFLFLFLLFTFLIDNNFSGDVDSCDEGDMTHSRNRLNNAIHLHPNHNHYHHHHHNFHHNHGLSTPSPPIPPPPLKSRLHSPFHRNLSNTHETKL